MSEKLKIFIEKSPLNYLRIVDEVGRDGNEGMICYAMGASGSKQGNRIRKTEGRKMSAI